MEIEAKYSILDPETTKALAPLSQIAGFQIRTSEARQILDTYLDTPDDRLMAAGYACRRRDNGWTSRINLKGLGVSDGTVHRREETSVEIDATTLTTPDLWPESTSREMVLRLGDHQPLKTLFEIHQDRHIRYFVHPERGDVAELSLDDVTFRGTDWQQQTTELEIELLEQGTEDDLAQIVTALRAWPGLVPQPTSKFERGMGLAYRYRSVGANLDLGNVHSDDTMGEATRKLLRPLFLRMQIHEWGTYRGEDPEELHDMRVMTRRMRTVFRMAEPYLVPEEIARIRKGLRKMARLLGAVRDMDVFREKTAHIVAEAGISPADIGLLTDVWNVEYTHRRNEMLSYINSRRYGRFKQDFWAKLAPALPERDPPAPVRAVVRKIISEQLAALLAQGQMIERPKAPLTAFHQLRIAAKHLRYTLTFFQDLLGPEAGPALDAVETVQDCFGELQDAVVAVVHLRAVTSYGTWEMPMQAGSLWQGSVTRASTQPATSGLLTVLEMREAEVDTRLADALATWHAFHKQGAPRLVQEALRQL